MNFLFKKHTFERDLYHNDEIILSHLHHDLLQPETVKYDQPRDSRNILQRLNQQLIMSEEDGDDGVMKPKLKRLIKEQ